MDGRAFLTVAQEIVRGSTEAHWRTAVGRSYYAFMLSLRDAFLRWGISALPQASVHQGIHRRVFTSSDTGMKQIGKWLVQLRDLRGVGDYELIGRREFSNDREARRCIRIATDALSLLDAIEADSARRNLVAAEVRAVFP
jgi:hypothetical protein